MYSKLPEMLQSSEGSRSLSEKSAGTAFPGPRSRPHYATAYPVNLKAMTIECCAVNKK